jgi:hypothetical protein
VSAQCISNFRDKKLLVHGYLLVILAGLGCVLSALYIHIHIYICIYIYIYM